MYHSHESKTNKKLRTDETETGPKSFWLEVNNIHLQRRVHEACVAQVGQTTEPWLASLRFVVVVVTTATTSTAAAAGSPIARVVAVVATPTNIVETDIESHHTEILKCYSGNTCKLC